MIVIVEGVDGSGKSTLVQELYNRGYPVQKVQLGQKVNWKVLSKTCNDCNLTIIEDRSPITDIVYRLYDKGEPDCKEGIEDVAAMFENYGVRLIYCNNNTSYKDGRKRGETNITTSAAHNCIKHIYDVIIGALERSYSSQIMHYDWHNDDVKDVIKFITRS